MIKYRKYIENLNRISNLDNLIIMSNINTTIAIKVSTRDDFKEICKEEGITYDGKLKHWIKKEKIKQNKKKKRG